MISVKAKNNNGIFDDSLDQYFVPVVNGKEYSSHAAETEDMALLIGLGIKYQGLNSQFAILASRMLQIESAWSK